MPVTENAIRPDPMNERRLHDLSALVRRRWKPIVTLVSILVLAEAYWFGPLLRTQWDNYWIPAPADAAHGRARTSVELAPNAPNRVLGAIGRARGLRAPRAIPAAEARIDDGALVLGVVAGGVPRAYLLDALAPLPRHVVNDVVGGQPVSVTYCSLSDCARAFTAPGGDEPLELNQLGVSGNDLVIETGGVPYLQSTGAPLDPGAHPAAFPFEAHPVSRMTWGEWKALHPDTDVYEGPRPGTGGSP